MKTFQCSHCKQSFETDADIVDNTMACLACGNIIVVPTSILQDGTHMGGFEIIKELGEGGMGVVYLAKQISVDRLVALKVLSKKLAPDHDALEQFKKEAQLAGKLNHPNIVQVIDTGEEGDFLYIAAKYIDGENLDNIIDSKTNFGEEKAIEMASTIGSALAYAWEKHGLLHKDIKPGNIMVTKKGHFFLTDFGISQSFELGRKKEEKYILGSPLYMSPEQTQALPLDWRSDLYSLGASIYHLAVGVPPYDAKNVSAIMAMHVSSPFPEPKTRNPKAVLSPKIIALLKKMLAKKPEDRFGSWQEFMEVINEAKKTEIKSIPLRSKGYKKGKETEKIKETKKGAGDCGIVKFDKLSALKIVASLVIVILASIASYKLFVTLKTNKAFIALQSAENHLVKYPGDYSGALSFFQYAVIRSKSTKYYQTALDRYAEIKEMAKGQEEKMLEFDKKIAEAQVLIKKKNYKKALEILRTVQNIDDENRKKHVMMHIRMLEYNVNQQNVEE